MRGTPIATARGFSKIARLITRKIAPERFEYKKNGVEEEREGAKKIFNFSYI